MTAHVIKLAYNGGLLLVDLIKVDLVREITVNLSVRNFVELGGWLIIELTMELFVSIVNRENSGWVAELRHLIITFVTYKQVIKLFKLERCFIGTVQTCNIAEIRTKAIKYIEWHHNLSEGTKN